MSDNDVKLAVLETKIDNLSEKVAELVDALKNHIDKEDEAFKRLEDMKANKWVEKAIISIGVSVIVSLIAFVVTSLAK